MSRIFVAAQSLLTEADLEEAGLSMGPVRSVSDLRDIAFTSNPERADAILAGYSVPHESDSGGSLVLTFAEFD